MPAYFFKYMKQKNRYVCSNCGSIASKWLGKCPDCGEWNTFEEEIIREPLSKGQAVFGNVSKPEQINKIEVSEHSRISTGTEELDRVLGGGLVAGSVILIGGPPGIGKSTLLLQVSKGIASKGKVLYISGEESPRQIKMRADRLGALSDNLYVLSEVNLEAIEVHCAETLPMLIILDSIQTIFKSGIESAPGSVSQVRECTASLVRIAKSQDSALIIVGHVTKDGSIAGPRVLEHLVDTVVYFEGERMQNFRIIKPIKNRFGSTDEAGIFEMTSSGLKTIKNPSAYFLEGRGDETSGSAIIPVIEGSRPILVEIQALVSKSYLAMPMRRCTGIDANRLALIIAVMEKRAGLQMSSQDVYASVVAGMQLDEPAADLAVAGALYSSYSDRPFPADCAVFGELGLGGEIRSVSYADKRIMEADRLGFKKIYIPSQNMSAANTVRNLKIEVIPVSNIKDFIFGAFKPNKKNQTYSDKKSVQNSNN